MANSITGALSGAWIDLQSAGHPLTFYQAVKAAGKVGVILDLQTLGWQTDYPLARQAGLGTMLFQGFWSPGFAIPTLAQQRGIYAVQQAKAVAYPAGAVSWLDWEAVPSDVTEAQGIAWISAWSLAVKNGGYAPGLYVGANQPLSALALYQQLIYISHYWRSCSASTVLVATRGYQMTQTACGQMIDGVPVDFDTAGTDALGGQPICALPDDPVTITTTTDWKPYVDALQAQVAAQHDQILSLTNRVAAAETRLQNASKALSD
ncbi:MAG: DUF1906 domain-containing protein [Gammaproteobacteria bacterium]|nr:DUF1906 domain-containing protein [Gammaproteobacteria bacterium]